MSKKISKKQMLIVVAALTAAIGGTTLYADYFKKVDGISYSFKMDKEVLGPWTVVDFVEKTSDFKPGEKKWGDIEYLKVMDFKEDGTVEIGIADNGKLKNLTSSLKWTKDHIISEVDETNSQYTIKKIDGKNYMFYEWKSGDYSFRENEPRIYVLEQGENIDIADAAGKVDDTNVPFENDEAMKGTWNSVDFVKNVEDFKPETQQWPDLFLKTLVFGEDGAVTQISKDFNESPSTDQVYWTKGSVVNKGNQTVSGCSIKEISGETYLFYEWKNGDYMFGGIEPYYYVLEKQH